MITIKYPRGEMQLDIVMFLQNHSMDDVHFLYKQVLRICEEPERVREEIRKDTNRYWRKVPVEDRKKIPHKYFRIRQRNLLKLMDGRLGFERRLRERDRRKRMDSR